MTQLRLLPTLLLLLAACSGPSGLPPEAFGMFENLNDPAFQKRLDMTSNAVSYSVRTTLAGARGEGISCRAPLPEGSKSMMTLDLNCGGTNIPFKLEYRSSQGDWVVTEEDAAPEIYGRLSR